MVRQFTSATKEDIAFIRSFSRNRYAGAVIRADRMLKTGDSIATFISPGTVLRDTLVVIVADHVLLRAILIPGTLITTNFIDLDTGVVLTNETLVVAAEGRIACVITRTGKNDAFHALTYGMFVAGNIVRAFIITLTIHCNARIILANVMFGRRTAIENNGIARVLAVPRHDDAGGVVLRAFGMLIAVDGVGAIVGTRTGNGNALILVVALVMRTRIASIDGVTFVGARSCHHLAGIADALQMSPTRHSITALIGPAAIDNHALVLIIAFIVFLGLASDIDVTFVGSVSRQDNTCGIVFRAFGMFAAIDDAGALIRTSTIYRFAFIFIRALRVLLAAPKDRIAFVVTLPIDRDTRGVVLVAFGVGLAGNQIRAFISSTPSHFHTRRSLARHVGLTSAPVENGIAFIPT